MTWALTKKFEKIKKKKKGIKKLKFIKGLWKFGDMNTN